MVKAWCIWCEDGSQQSTSGYYWIHQKCADEMMDYSDDIKDIKEILQGIHTRNKGDKDKLNVVYEFIKDTEDFKRRWDNTMNLLKNKTTR